MSLSSNRGSSSGNRSSSSIGGNSGSRSMEMGRAAGCAVWDKATLVWGGASKDVGEGAWRRYYARFMVFWAVFVNVAIVLQIVKLYETESSEDLSIPMFVMFLCSQIFYFVYAFTVLKRRNYVIVLGTSIGIALYAFLLISVAAFGSSSSSTKAKTRTMTTTIASSDRESREIL